MNPPQHCTILVVDDEPDIRMMLAKQTAEATQDIRLKIEGIQVSTEGTVAEINQIEKVISDVNENVAQSSAVSEAIAKDILEVPQAAADMAQGSHQANQSAGELSKMAEQLQAMVNQFRI